MKSPRVAGEILSSDRQLANADKRRARNADAERCINDTNPPTHGPRVRGVRCWRCYLVHRFGADAVRDGRVPIAATQSGGGLMP